MMLIRIIRAHEVFHDKVIFFTWAAPSVTIIGGSLRIRALTILTYLRLGPAQDVPFALILWYVAKKHYLS